MQIESESHCKLFQNSYSGYSYSETDVNITRNLLYKEMIFN
jgi:hypothetical protein